MLIPLLCGRCIIAPEELAPGHYGLYWQRVMQAREEDVRSAANGVALAQARLTAGDTIPAEVAQAEMELRRAGWSGTTRCPA